MSSHNVIINDTENKIKTLKYQMIKNLDTCDNLNENIVWLKTEAVAFLSIHEDYFSVAAQTRFEWLL